MVKSQDAMLKQAIADFRAEYGFSFEALITALNEAGISHYSAGFGTKRVTFDIFPAAGYVKELLNLLSLSRSHRNKGHHGYKDASMNGDYNPAQEFVQYLRRWTLFSEQVMQHEGASPRGVAAARAKLIMADLHARFTSGNARAKTGRRSPGAIEMTDFFQLMRAIGLHLENHEQTENLRTKDTAKETQQHNYFKALAAAQGTSVEDLRSRAAA